MDNSFEYILIKGGRLYDPSQDLDKVADLLIGEGKILWWGEKGNRPQFDREGVGNGYIFNASGLTITPGFIDLHCHLREPGFEEKETIFSGTRAAARGGFTTVCCMPNTNPSIDSASTVEYICRKAEEAGNIRVLPIGCISKGRKGEQLAEMGELYEAGVVGFSDDGSPVMNSVLMLHALEYSKSFGLPVIDHCEDLNLSAGGVMNEGAVSSLLGLKGIPAVAEEIIVARDIALAELSKARLHVAHVSTEGSLEIIKRAKERGLPVTCEVTPHHLALTEEWVKGYNSNAKVNPPLRTRKDILALSRGLEEGWIDVIATDHAPQTIEEKLCEFDIAAFGISGLETALGSLFTLVEGLSFKTLVSKLTSGPAKLLQPLTKESPTRLKISPYMGTLRVGAPADVVAIDLDKRWEVNTGEFLSKGRNSPLAGMTLKGKVIATLASGKISYIEEPGRMMRV